MATESVETRLNNLEGAVAQLTNAIGCLEANQTILTERDEAIATEVETLKDCQTCGLEEGDCFPNVVFGYVANIGNNANSAMQEEVFDMMDAWEPRGVFIPGESNYQNPITPSTIAASLAVFQDWIDDEKFYYAIGENDGDGDGSVTNYRGYFPYLNNAYHYYKQFVDARILLISYCTAKGGGVPVYDPDGVNRLSDQYAWAQKAARDFPDDFKILLGTNPPSYTAAVGVGGVDLQPENLGIKLCLYGNTENPGEHLLIRGVHYLNLGGGSDEFPAGGALTGVDADIIWQGLSDKHYAAKITAREFDVLVQVHSTDEPDEVAHEIRIPR